MSIDSTRSLKDGQWTDPTIWSTSRVPTVDDEVILLHAVTIPSGTLAEGKSLAYESEGHLIFQDSTSKLQLGFTVSSTQLKLKTVKGGSINTTYTYDSQSRLTSISKADGSLAVIVYGDPEKKYVYADDEINYTYYVKYPNASNLTTGEITRYPLVVDGTNYQATTYTLGNSKIYPPGRLRYVYYYFDMNKHVTVVFRYLESGPTGDNYIYTYKDGNITIGNISYSGGHLRTGPYLYTFDNKINPLFGLLDQDIDDIQQFSLNNLISIVRTDVVPQSITTYDYEYNSHGLPLKRTKKQGGTVLEVLTYTYE